MKSNKGETNFWMIGFFTLLIGVVFYIGKNYSNFFPKTSQSAPTITIVQPTSAPSLLPTETVIPSPTIPQKSDLEGIKEAFTKKYSKSIDQVEVSISKNNGTQATG